MIMITFDLTVPITMDHLFVTDFIIIKLKETVSS